MTYGELKLPRISNGRKTEGAPASYVEGTHCPLARRGYSRDREPGNPQIEFGLLTSATGVPVAIEAFAGNTAAPTTFQAQVQKVRQRFGVADVIWVTWDQQLAERAALVIEVVRP